MPATEIAVLVTTWQRPRHLERCLASLRAQRGVAGRMEIVVADDGSTDETPDLVAAFARSADFPVSFTTHAHDGFHVARCRNEAVRASTAPYLLFTDGDCVLPPRHVATHLRCRRPGFVRTAESARLRRDESEKITVEAILAGRVRPRVPTGERRRRKYLVWQSFWFNLRDDPARPELYGNDFALWRSDYERVNGHDERYRGWGCEDVDLGTRLRRAGVRITSILHRTRPWHLWHPVDPSVPEADELTPNRRYLRTGEHPVRCEEGLERRADPRDGRESPGSPPG